MNINQNKKDLITCLLNIKNEHELTQAELGKMVGVSQPRLSTMLNYHIDDYKLDAILSYLEKIGITLDLNQKKQFPIRVDKKFLSQRIKEVKAETFQEKNARKLLIE